MARAVKQSTAPPPTAPVEARDAHAAVPSVPAALPSTTAPPITKAHPSKGHTKPAKATTAASAPAPVPVKEESTQLPCAPDTDQFLAVASTTRPSPAQPLAAVPPLPLGGDDDDEEGTVGDWLAKAQAKRTIDAPTDRTITAPHVRPSPVKVPIDAAGYDDEPQRLTVAHHPAMMDLRGAFDAIHDTKTEKVAPQKALRASVKRPRSVAPRKSSANGRRAALQDTISAFLQEASKDDAKPPAFGDTMADSSRTAALRASLLETIATARSFQSSLHALVETCQSCLDTAA